MKTFITRSLAVIAASAVALAANAAVDPAFDTAVTTLSSTLIEYMTKGFVGFLSLMGISIGFKFIWSLARRVGK
jgi:hypothetical protein